jgi:nucleoid-associated protein YgaU/DNA-binding SARP family transcriptional activator
MSVQTNHRTPHRAADLGRGLVSLASVVALVVGVPVALVAWVGSPLPAAMPSLSEITTALGDTYIPDEFLIKALALVCWLVWAELAVSLVVEAVAYARGRKAGAVPLAGGLQRSAARLVAGVALLSAVVATRGTPQPATRSPHEIASTSQPVVAVVVDEGEVQQPQTDTPPEQPDAPAPVYEVRHRDTLWDIAERHLGDPLRWQEILDLNHGHPQPDGRALADPDLIQVGWRLRLPADAIGVTSPAPPESGAAAPEEDPASGTGGSDVEMQSSGADGDGDGGMVLIDDGAPGGSAGEAVAVSEAPGAPDVPEPPAVTPHPAEQAAIEAPAQQPPPSPPAAPAEVTVQPGDNFWAIAEAQLAAAWGRPPTDAEVVGHWLQLIEQNRDRLAPPHDPDLIHPGQVFAAPAVPHDPTVPHSVSPPAAETPAPGTEQQGPAGTADAPPTVEEAPPGEEAPPVVDEGPSAGETPFEEAPPVDQAPPVDEAPPGEEAPPVEEAPPFEEAPPVVEAPADDPAADGSAADDPAAGDPEDAREPSADVGGGTAGEGDAVVLPGPRSDNADEAATGAQTEDAADDEAGATVPVGLAGGGIALAGVLVVLERRRRAQQRHRRRGRVVPLPPPHLRDGEQDLRWGADIEGARLLDVAMRAAAAGAGATGLPPLRWAEARPDAAMLVLSDPSPAPPGFLALDATRWVSTLSTEELSLIAAHAAAPAPTLTPVGTTEHGSELLVDLEASGVTAVGGAPDDVAGLLRAMVVAASTALWSDQVRIVTVGLDRDLGRLPGVGAVASLADALDAAEAHAARTEAALRALRCPSIGQARAVGAAPEECDPLVVVAAVPPGDRSEQRRLEALAERPNSAVGVVTLPGIAMDPWARTFTIGDHGWLEIADVSEPVRPRHLSSGDVRALVDLLEGARQRVDDDPGDTIVALAPRRPPLPAPPPAPEPAAAPADSRVGPAGATPAGPTPAGEPQGAQAPGPQVLRVRDLVGDVEVLVRVLGEVEAVRIDRSGAAAQEVKLVPTRQRALEAVTYLALRESAVDREDLEISLFPHGANAAKTIYNTISAARSLVGEALFPPPGGGRYELSPAVVTDYGLFCEMVAAADELDDAAAAADVLADALTLVRGEPFTGVGRSYAWVGPHRGMIVAQVVDAAEELAEVRLAMGDWRSAEWAARQGLRAFPSDERMYRLLMRTARAAGNIPGVQRVFRELCDVLADPDLGVEPEDTLHPETIELLEELTGSPARQHRMGA